MQEVDLIGTSSVANLIEQSGLTKFTISRVGQHKNSVPVYEFVGSKNTNRQAKDSFVAWSNTILYGGQNNNVYELYLFNDFDTNSEGVELKHAKNSKLRMTFVLNNNPKEIGVLNGIGEARTNEVQSIADLVKLAVQQYASERDNKDLAKEISKLREELQELKDDDDDDDEDDKQKNMLMQLGGVLLSKFGNKGQAEPVVINGVDEKEENVNRAIKILWKHDKNLDSDLLKLGALAENNTQQFNFLINALRNL
jgi:hypothetical protein